MVAILTGHLLKDTDYVVRYHSDTLNLDGAQDKPKDSIMISGTLANHPLRVPADCDSIKAALEKAADDSRGRQDGFGR